MDCLCSVSCEACGQQSGAHWRRWLIERLFYLISSLVKPHRNVCSVIAHGFTMTLQPAQLQETIAFVAADRAALVKALTIGPAISSDDSLAAELRKLARASDVRT